MQGQCQKKGKPFIIEKKKNNFIKTNLITIQP